MVDEVRPEALDKKLASLGPDMLNDPPDADNFRNRLHNRGDGKTLAEVLMNQGVFSGVGNYVKAEALYLAELSPHRRCESLTLNEVERLRQQVIAVMRASYANDGATIRSYLNVDSTKGGMKTRFLVYGNRTDPMGNPVVKEETADGRTTHWVPTVQK
jgi:formamidopyrimidine-DNA glycosylase